MRVAVTGATGFVGRRLVALLLEGGHDVTALTRDETRARRSLGAKPAIVQVDPLDADAVAKALEGAGGVVNLQGENLFARRWNEDVREAVRTSRVEGTRTLVRALGALGASAPKVLVSASAVGVYGSRGADEVLDETAEVGEGFLAGVCVAWEEAAREARAHGVRVAIARIGAVLGEGGGALAAMEVPFRRFAGGPVGSGDQVVSWIHVDDLCRLLGFLFERDDLEGVFNATAPQPVSNRVFSQALGDALGRPSWLRVPSFALRVALGGVSEVVTRGQRVVPRRAREAGFVFRHPRVGEALRSIYG